MCTLSGDPTVTEPLGTPLLALKGSLVSKSTTALRFGRVNAEKRSKFSDTPPAASFKATPLMHALGQLKRV